jgi:hypothetical protein
MASFRSRRIEALLGSSIDDATQADVTSLITTGAVEDFDLDFKGKLYGFKEKLYGNGDSDKRGTRRGRRRDGQHRRRTDRDRRAGGWPSASCERPGRAAVG